MIKRTGLVQRLRDVGLILQTVRNPHMLILDRLGLLSHDYRLQLRNGLKLDLRPGTSDRFSVFEVFVRSAYARGPTEIFPGATVVDVGANIGCFTLYAASKAGPAGKVIAVEPMPHVYDRLKHNVALNGLAHVSPICAAVAAQNGEAELFIGDHDLFSSLHVEVNGKRLEGKTVSVPTFTLDKVMSDFELETIDFLKLDCEGAEYSILESIPETRLNKINHIIAELHAADGHRPVEFVDSLKSKGFSHLYVDNHYFQRA